MSITWVVDSELQFVWQCCESPPFCMVRDNDGHVYPYCVEDLHCFETPFERVKPDGWTPPNSTKDV